MRIGGCADGYSLFMGDKPITRMPSDALGHIFAALCIKKIVDGSEAVFKHRVQLLKFCEVRFRICGIRLEYNIFFKAGEGLQGCGNCLGGKNSRHLNGGNLSGERIDLGKPLQRNEAYGQHAKGHEARQ